jgi:hypothetical protein
VCFKLPILGLCIRTLGKILAVGSELFALDFWANCVYVNVLNYPYCHIERLVGFLPLSRRVSQGKNFVYLCMVIFLCSWFIFAVYMYDLCLSLLWLLYLCYEILKEIQGSIKQHKINMVSEPIT